MPVSVKTYLDKLVASVSGTGQAPAHHEDLITDEAKAGGIDTIWKGHVQRLLPLIGGRVEVADDGIHLLVPAPEHV